MVDSSTDEEISESQLVELIGLSTLGRGSSNSDVHRGLDVATLRVCRIAWELCARDDRRRAAAEDGDAVPTLLAFPHCLVARTPDRGGGKLSIGGLQLLH